MKFLKQYAAWFMRNLDLISEQGQSLIEYTLLLAFIALVAFAVMSQAGTGVKGIWTTANTTVANAASSASGGSGSSGGGLQSGSACTSGFTCSSCPNGSYPKNGGFVCT